MFFLKKLNLAFLSSIFFVFFQIFFRKNNPACARSSPPRVEPADPACGRVYPATGWARRPGQWHGRPRRQLGRLTRVAS